MKFDIGKVLSNLSSFVTIVTAGAAVYFYYYPEEVANYLSEVSKATEQNIAATAEAAQQTAISSGKVAENTDQLVQGQANWLDIVTPKYNAYSLRSDENIHKLDDYQEVSFLLKNPTNNVVGDISLYIEVGNLPSTVLEPNDFTLAPREEQQVEITFSKNISKLRDETFKVCLEANMKDVSLYEMRTYKVADYGTMMSLNDRQGPYEQRLPQCQR